jgi:hypothetical protein
VRLRQGRRATAMSYHGHKRNLSESRPRKMVNFHVLKPLTQRPQEPALPRHILVEPAPARVCPFIRGADTAPG